MIMGMERRLGVAVAAGLAAAAVLAALGMGTAVHLQEDVADLDHTRDLQLRVQQITAALIDLDANQRRYRMTGHQDDLEASRSAMAELDRKFTGLRVAASGSADDAEQVDPLRGLVDARREHLARSIGEANGPNAATAAYVPEAEQDDTRSDELRQGLARLADQLSMTQAQRHAARSSAVTRNERLVALLSAVLGLSVAALFALVRRDRAMQARMRATDAEAREGLERSVSERTAELRSATGRLALSEDRLGRVFDFVIEGILTTDETQVIVAANPASARMFGCKVSDLIGTPLERLIPVRHRSAHRLSVEAFGQGAIGARPMLASNGRRNVMALRFDGEEFPIEASISRAEVDGRRFYTVIHRDLSEQRRAEAALDHSRQMIAATFDASSVAMAQIDPATRRFLAVNDALCRLSGFTRDELLSRGPDDLNHPDDRLDVSKLGALMQGHAPYREEKRLVRKDGQLVWVEISGSIVRDAEQRPVRLVGILQDITARRQVEGALRERERRQAFLVTLNDRLRTLADPKAIAYEAACLLGEFAQVDRVGYAEDDGNGETITVARNYTRDVPGIEGRYRYSDYGDQLVTALRAGRTVVRPDVAHDPSLSDDEKAAHAALQLGATVNVPLMQDGRLHAVFFVHSAAAHDWSEDEVALFEDVAQRLRADFTRATAQAAERAAGAKLEAALDSMNDAVFIADAEGRFVDFNDAFLSFHRLRSREECPRELAEYLAILDVFMADGSPAPFDQWAVPRALRGEVASSVEYRLRRKDSGETWVGSYSFAPIRSDDGRITGAVVTGRDVTRLKQIQEELATSHAALRHLIANQQRAQEEERKRIARELHDDLQQSLAAIRMDALAIGERVAAGRRDVAPLLARIDRLSGSAITSARRIVSDLRPELLEELGLLPALEALCAEHAKRTGATCRFEVTAGGGSVALEDPLLSIGLFRISQEALNNAAKHADASAVTVQLGATESGLVMLRVSDNGVGMDQRAARRPGSFGLLGMAERVRALGGHLRVEGQGGRGTVVEALVPVVGPPAADAAPLAGAPGMPEAAAGLQPGLGLWDVWGRPLQAVVDALEGSVAVLDRQGSIQFVNRSWREFAATHGVRDLAGSGPGVNYLDVCRRSAGSEPSASLVLRGLGAVLEGRDESFTFEYLCDVSGGRRWFRLHAASITGGLVIVSHADLVGFGKRAAGHDGEVGLPGH